MGRQLTFLVLLVSACAHAPKIDVRAVYQRAWEAENLAVYQDAEAQLKKHLAENPSDPARPGVQLDLGKITFALGSFREAATLFESCAADAELKEACTKNAALALLRVEKDGPEKPDAFVPLRARAKKDNLALPFQWPATQLAAIEAGKKYSEKPIATVKQQLADACDRYFAVGAKRDDARRIVRFAAAEIYFSHNRFEAAGERCVDVIEGWPNSNEAKACTHGVLDAYTVRKNWSALESYARSVHDTKLYGANREITDRVNASIEHGTFNAILALVKNDQDPDQLRVAAARFAAYQREFPDSSHADRALFNAVVYFARSAQIDDAIAAGQLLLETYRDSEFIKDTESALRELRKSRH